MKNIINVIADHVEEEENEDNMSEEEFDSCVMCGAKTKYKKSDHIDYRSGYIEGAGQLCIVCTRKLYKIDG